MLQVVILISQLVLLNIVYQNNLIETRLCFELVTRGLEIATCEFELITRRTALVIRKSELVTRVLLFHKLYDVILFIVWGYRRNPPVVFLGRYVLKICSKFTGKHSCRSVTSITLFCKFIETTLWRVCSPVNLLHIFRISFYKNTSGGLLLWLPLTLLESWIHHKDFELINNN